MAHKDAEPTEAARKGIGAGTWAAIAGVVVGLGALGTVAAITLAPTRDEAFAQCAGGAVAGGDIGGPFTLVNGDGVTVTEAEVITAPTIVYFGYTFCPDICPVDVARNGFALEELEDRGIIANGAFITIDPDRDTVDVVRDFAANFHERMVGLTGTPEQIAAAARAYRTVYSKPADATGDFYLMNHMTYSYLMLPEYGFVDFFTNSVTPEAMADRVACFVAAAS